MTTAALPVPKATRENTVKGEEMFLNDVKQVVAYMAECVNNVMKMSTPQTCLISSSSPQVRAWFPWRPERVGRPVRGV